MATMKRSKCYAFSLIEIALALGLFFFVIVALLGLFSVGIQSGQRSQQDTAVALAAMYSITDIQKAGSGTPTNTLYIFDYEGVLIGNSQRVPYYTNHVEFVPNVAPFQWPNGGQTNLIGVKMTFTSPRQTATTGHDVEVFWTAITR